MKSPFLSIVSIACVSLQGIAVGAELFDGPGPGYRQQMDRLSPQKNRTVAIRVQAPTVIVRSLSDESLFSQPVRLTLGGPTTAATKPAQ
jgi:hypothetical protein